MVAQSAKRLVSPRQVARAIGVSESSLKRWCDRGLLPTVRTAGGHRRLPIAGVLDFLRSGSHALVRPELLGLPAATGQGPRVLEKARRRLVEALLAGEEDLVRQTLFDLYLAGHSIAAIGDEVVAGAFHQIGAEWHAGEAEIYEERRACQLALRALHELRGVLPPPAGDAPLAMGGTPSGDPYAVPTALVELALGQAGWRATSLGSDLPLSTLRQAIEAHRPRLFWLSVSVVPETGRFLEEYDALYRSVPRATAIVVGGRGLDGDIRRKMKYAAFCDSLAHLESFATTLAPPAAHDDATGAA